MQKAKTILIIDDNHSILIEKLKQAGFIIDYHPEYDYQEVEHHIEKYDAIVVRSKVKIDKKIIDKGTNLKCIARSGAGMDAIDVEYAESKGIKCLNSPEGNRDAVGEHTMGLLLCLLNKINIADRQVRKYQWLREENRGTEIKGKCVGIVGYGNMGKSFAKRLYGFDCKVIAYDNQLKNYSDQYAQQCSLEELFENTDILSLHIPLNDDNYHFVNKDFINNFKKPFYLINTSRGKVVSLSDLKLSMQEGKILGCGLDVLETEDFSNQLEQQNSHTDNNNNHSNSIKNCNSIENNSPLMQELDDLFKMPNTVFTPHVAGWTKESYYKLASFLADKIILCLKEK